MVTYARNQTWSGAAFQRVYPSAPDCSLQIEEELNVGGLKRLTPPTFKENSAQYHTFSRFRAEELNVGGLKRLSQPTFKENSAQYHGPDGNTFSRFCLWFI